MNLETLGDVAARAATASFRSKGDMFAYWQDSFTAVQSEWVRIRQLSPIVSSVFDSDRIGKSEKLSFDLVDYACDIERATETALKDAPELQRIWFQLAQGEAADPKLAQSCTAKCGRVYAARRLEPWKYHVRDKHPKRNGVR